MPLQSLTLLNSEFVRHRAGAFAKRLERDETNDAKRLSLAFAIVYSRAPSRDEELTSFAFLKEQEGEYGGGSKAREKAWVDLCHSLLMSNEFLYVD
jgi:hypothetical protein